MSQNKTVNVSIVLVGQVLNTLLSFLLLPYLSRKLSYDMYGTYGQAIIIVDIVKIIFSLGLPVVLNYYYSNHQEGRSEVFKSSFLFSVGSGILGAILLFIASPAFNGMMNNSELGQYIQIYALSLPFQILFVSFYASLVYHEKIKTATIILVISNVIRLILFALIIQLTESLALLFKAAIFVAFVQAILCFIYLPKELKKGMFKIKVALGWEQMKYGIPFAFSTLIAIAMRFTDMFMISKMIDTKHFALYKNGAFEIPILATFYVSVTTVLMPEMSKLYNKGNFDEILKLKKKGLTTTAVLIYPFIIFALFFNEEIITFIFSNKYALSADVFFIFSFILFTRVTNLRDIQAISNKTSVLMLVNVVAFVFNIGLNYFMITNYGIKGAAFATVFSMAVVAFLLVWHGATIIKKSFWDLFDFRPIIISFAIALALSTALYFTYQLFENKMVFLACSAAYAVIIPVLLMKFRLIEIGIIKSISTRIPFKQDLINKIIDRIYY